MVRGDGRGWSPQDAWHVSPDPVLQIGQESGPGELRFNRIRRILTLPSGDILVVNGGGPPGLRIFSISGEPLVSFGGQGDGPGEFSSLFNAWLIEPDTIVTFDSRQSRASWFHISGAFIRDQLLASLRADNMVVRGRYDDGSWLLAANTPEHQERSEGRVSLRMIATGSADGTRIDSIGYFEEATLVRHGTDFELQVFMPGFATYTAVGQRLYAGYPDAFEIQVRSPDGTVLHTIHRTEGVQQLTDELFNELADARVAAADADRRPGMRRYLLEAPRPEHLPAFSGNPVVDSDGNLWVQAFVLPDREATSWSIFNHSGRYLGDVQLPTVFTPHEIQTNRILGVWRDECDVETVRAYTLHR